MTGICEDSFYISDRIPLLELPSTFKPWFPDDLSSFLRTPMLLLSYFGIAGPSHSRHDWRDPSDRVVSFQLGHPLRDLFVGLRVY